MKRDLMKIISSMEEDQRRIKRELKKEKTENLKSAYLYGEKKQIDFYLDWLKMVLKRAGKM